MLHLYPNSNNLANIDRLLWSIVVDTSTKEHLIKYQFFFKATKFLFTSESFEHFDPPVDQPLPAVPHPTLHNPLMQLHCTVHF
jgi:hypothetical protein